MVQQAVTIIGWVLAPICSALVVALAGSRRRIKEIKEKERSQHDEERRMMSKTFKAILRAQLVDAYREYVIEKKPLTVERKHEITEAYEAYAYWGGNGTGRHMYEAICEITVVVIN